MGKLKQTRIEPVVDNTPNYSVPNWNQNRVNEILADAVAALGPYSPISI